MSTSEKWKITLGSGELFFMEYTGTIPSTEEICKPENRLGHISGGATLEYKPSYYVAKDDLGVVSKTIMTEEEATLKSGILTFTGETLTRLVETGRVEESGTLRTVKIGGVKNSNRKNYVLCFSVHDAADGDCWVMIVGRNEAGFSMSFAKDKETVIDAEFTCQPMDSEGTLITYIEEIKTGVSPGLG